MSEKTKKKKKPVKETSAVAVVSRHRELVQLLCKICKLWMGYAEHERMNMAICKDCGVWYHRELFRQKRLPREAEIE